ncbi:family 20 glycosylhydrolase [Jeongeupia sp. USM3]|uniref:family 20 glycosylhydrolase n=1 Tax=Jeongeupia sp. USM3 TaxID=1906741 RepID=UPI00089DD812|nr:family 20 glycosylhydrolase [Jeongeupia sp. USM3]AOY01341.1 beta-N-acetylhexosaminidase [Jeongeupia sp. USM3]
MKKKLTLMMASMALAGFAYAGSGAQQQVDTIASQLGVQFTMQGNLPAKDCSALGADWASCYKLTFTLDAASDIKGKDWTIYFSSIRRVLQLDNDQFKVTHLTGDLYKLEPTDKFQGFTKGQPVQLGMIAEYWQVSIYDTMPRWYVTSGDATPKVIASTDTEDLGKFVTPFKVADAKRSATDNNIIMTTATRYDAYKTTPLLPAGDVAARILPSPVAQKLTGKTADLSNGIKLDTRGLDKTSADALRARAKEIGLAAGSYPVTVRIAPKSLKGAAAKAEGYSLVITPKGAQVVGHDAAGAFYGVQSLLSLVPAQGAKIVPTMEVADAPRFDYRGFMIDIARNFHSKETIIAAIDQMAAYKLNKLHMHLSDDEGWRIQIPGLPELTDVGGKRVHDLSETKGLLPQLGQGPDSSTPGSGYLTRADFIEILKYAKARNIEVIPEIDMPGHARAAVVSMEARYKRLMAEGKTEAANEYRLVDPQETTNTTGVQFYNRMSTLNPCQPGALKFTDKVIGEVARMYKDAGLKLTTWHFGGDEAKNIFLGAGYADKNAPAKDKDGKGWIDMSKQDHPWAKSPACEAMVKSGKIADVEHLPGYFAHEVSTLLPKYGISNFQAWQDGLKFAPGAKDFAAKKVRVNFWDTLYWGGSDTAADWSNKGYGVIISNPDYVYLDFPSEVDPYESGYYWGSRGNSMKRVFSFAPANLPQNAETSTDRDGNVFEAKASKPMPPVEGLSAQLWSEVIRTDARWEYMAFPRILAVAERAWHQASWERPYTVGERYKAGETKLVNAQALNSDWVAFANVVGQRELAKLDKAGIGYRLPMVGAKVVDGKLSAVTELPGVAIQYSLDAGKTWQAYDAGKAPAVADANAAQVRTVSFDGKRFGRATGLIAK